MFSDKWNRHFLRMALAHAAMSKDPRTQVGSVIVGPDKEILSIGFNGFPRGIADTEERLTDKNVKLKLVVHAELNAILAAARSGTSGLKGKTMYVACTDSSGLVWGGPPCTRCTVEVIQAGISTIVAYPWKTHEQSSWTADLDFAKVLLKEAGIEFIEVTP